jgi:putative glutamine amidotransferase
MLELALGVAYPEAISRAGAVPVIVPPLPRGSIEPLLDGVRGLVLTGGPDIDPCHYGAEAHPELGPVEREIDVFELALLRAALRRRLPVLGICRGMQLLNVALGGSLVQDLPSAGGEVEHRQTDPGVQPTHDVELEAGSRIAGLVGATSLRVNSFHHQAIDRLGRGVRAVGWAPDGVVEAVEVRRQPFCIGVQWHAESLVGSAEQTRLLTAFTEAALQLGERIRPAA